MKYAVFGSCVTRDIFSILERDELVNEYRSRCSLHSYTAPPIPLEQIPDLSEMSSDFQRRMVQLDFSKSTISNDEQVPIVVDFIDERFNVLNYGNSLITESNEFQKIAKENSQYTLAFKRGIQEETQFREACRKFRLMHQGVPVILHSSRWATHFSTDAGLEALDKEKYIETMNRSLEMYEDIFVDEVSPIGVVRVSPSLRIADKEHRWGLAPFHYIREYYESAFRILLEISATL